MLRMFVRATICVAVVSMVGHALARGQTPEEEKLVAALKKLGVGAYPPEKQPGKPIQSVVISNPKITNALARDIKQFKDLERFTVLKGGITEDFFTELQGCEKMQMIHTRYVTFTEKGIRRLAEFKALTNLRLGDANISDDALKGFSEFKNHENLKAITLGYNPITDAGLKELAVLKGLTTLKEIALTYTMVTKEGTQSLQKLLPKVTIVGSGK